MRAVKAKQLRSIAKYAGKRGLPDVAYRIERHKPKLVPTGELNENGTPKMVAYTPTTMHLGECVRQVYKQLKKAA